MSPRGLSAASFAAGVSKRRICEKTWHSRMRRAMTCVYCEPKSRMTMFSGIASRDCVRFGLGFRGSGHAAYLLPMPTPCTVWKTLPSVLIAGAMMISVS